MLTSDQASQLEGRPAPHAHTWGRRGSTCTEKQRLDDLGDRPPPRPRPRPTAPGKRCKPGAYRPRATGRTCAARRRSWPGAASTATPSRQCSASTTAAEEPAPICGRRHCPKGGRSTTIPRSLALPMLCTFSCRKAGRLHRFASSISSRLTFALRRGPEPRHAPVGGGKPGPHT